MLRRNESVRVGQDATPERLIHSMLYPGGGSSRSRHGQSSDNSGGKSSQQSQPPQLSKLYGREAELEVLHKALKQAQQSDAKNAAAQVILITGASGTGKSTLVEHAFSLRSKMLFGMGKFEEMADPKPFAALLGAVADLCGRAFHLDQQQQFESLNLLPEDSEEPEAPTLVQRLEDELSEEVLDILRAVIPEFAAVFDEVSNAMISLNEERRKHFLLSSHSVEGLEQLKYSLKLLLRAVATPQTPVVLCLDDLQWMDPGTLSIIRAIVVDHQLTNFIFVGVCSDSNCTSTNGISPDHVNNEVMEWMDELKDVTKSPLARSPIWIRAGDLDLAHVSLLLSDLLRVSIEEVRDLSELVHQRTNGNAFHILQLLDTLQREELLTKPLGSVQWEWEIETIRKQTSLSDNVVELVQRKMEHLPAPAQAVLKVCAMLGSTFSKSILGKVHSAISSEVVTVEIAKETSSHQMEESSEFTNSRASSSNIVEVEKVDEEDGTTKWTLSRCIQTLIDEGILEELQCSRYKFMHNRICQVAMGLVGNSPIERAEIHAEIGMCLWESLGFPANLDQVHLQKHDHHLFVCADHMNLGRSCLPLKQNNLRVDLARLNNQAAKRAAAYSAFVPSLNYLQTGIDMLIGAEGATIETCWMQHYDLCLEMYTSLAEMCLSAGRLGDCTEAAQIALKCQRPNSHDADGAFLLYLDCLSQRTQYAEMLELSLGALRDFGEVVPSHPRRIYTNRVLDRTKKLLEKMPIDDIMNLPCCPGERETTILRMMYSMNFPAVFLERSNLATVIKCRMLELTVQYGLTDMAAPALAGMAPEFVSRLDDVDLGVWTARIAVKILEKEKNFHKHASKVHLNANLVLHWREPLSITVDHWIKTHKLAMQAGDTATACLAATGYHMFYFYSGLPLAPLLSDTQNFCLLMDEYKSYMQLLLNVPVLQTVLNLTGHSNNILVIHQGSAKRIRDCVGWESRTGEQSEWSYEMQIAFYCEDFSLATEHYKKVEALEIGSTQAHPFYQARVFFFALICIHNAKESATGKKMKWRVDARRHYHVVKGWVLDKQAINVAHKLMILEAAMFTMEHCKKKKHDEVVANAFNKAIIASTKSGFFQDAALACHLASRSVADTELRDQFFGRACELYLRWGAKGIVDYLCKKPEHSDTSYEISVSEATSRRHLLNGFRSRTRYDDTLREEHQSLHMGSNSNIASNPSVGPGGNSSHSVPGAGGAFLDSHQNQMTSSRITASLKNTGLGVNS